MKKRLLSLLLILVALINLSGPAEAESDIAFLAVNDTLPYALNADTMPFYSGGILYIPYNIFEIATTLGVWVSYNPTSMTLVLFNKSEKLFFDIALGLVTDEDDDTYEMGIIVRNGMAFIPANFCVNYFGASLSCLVSVGNYSVYRITTGSQVLSNSAFINQADTLIEEMADAYLSSITALQQSPAQISPTAIPQVEPEAVQEDEPQAPAYEIYPVILGPSSQAADWLDEHEQKAAFFLTAREINENRELVRELALAGHTLGVTGTTAGALSRANEALYDAVGETTLLALIDTQTAPEGYIVIRADADAETFYRSPTEEPCIITLSAQDPMLLDYLDVFEERCTLHQLIETTAPAMAGAELQ